MTSRHLSRRSLLAATGASALLLPLLNQTRGLAATPAFPKRVIFVVTGNGTIENSFWPTGGIGADLKLAEITSPLEKHKQSLIFPKGVDLRVWAEENPFGGNGDSHHCWGSVLTGTKPATGDPPHDPGGPGLALASSQSIDQYIGQQLNKQKAMPFPVLSVRAFGRDGSGYSTLSWTGSKAPFSAESDPRKLFTSLFSGVSTGAPDPTLVRLRKKRQSVLDYVGKSLERQSQRLGTEDRQKVQLHLEAVRNIERQLEGGPVTSSCQPPTVPTGVDFKAMANFPALVDTEMDQIVAAMACGLTQVSTLALGDGEDYNIFFPFLDISQKGIEFPERHHHDISHRPGVNDHDKIVVEQWYLSQVAKLFDKLAAVPEGDGTMLDNTVVFYMNSLNSGFSHTVLKVPVVIGAGKNIAIRTGGRVMELKNEAHNTLLAAVANAVDVPMASFGDPRFPGVLNLA